MAAVCPGLNVLMQFTHMLQIYFTGIERIVRLFNHLSTPDKYILGIDI